VIRFGAPLLFVLIWSTGFVVARVAAPHADLQLFLVLRFALTAAVMGLAALVTGAKWPRGREL
jgi:drug/metabolite transporter (DMT)-like permease